MTENVTRRISHWHRRLFVEKTDNTVIQLARYAAVGGVAFIVDFGTLWALTEFAGFHYLTSAAIAFVLGLLTNYIISILWVFSARKLDNPWMEFAVFALVGVAGLGLNELAMYAGSDVLGFHYLLSKIVSTVFVFAWNFFVRKFLLYR